MTHKEWEDLCRRCGLCCFEKWTEGDRVHHTRIPCQHLDIVTRLCRVYDKRLDVGEGCVQLTPGMVRKIRWLPEECAYVHHLQRHPAVKNDE
jgi:uncharacterized cysteine cluster protein YcgN (CxxCxxCC family)